MTDDELCDALVEAGILDRHTRSVTRVKVYRVVGEIQYHSASRTLERWAVAGACMERMSGIDVLCVLEGWYVCVETAAGRSETRDKSLPRAIIEAFVEAHKCGA